MRERCGAGRSSLMLRQRAAGEIEVFACRKEYGTSTCPLYKLKRTYGPRRPESLVVELITALLQGITETVISPNVDGYVLLVCSAFEVLALGGLHDVSALSNGETCRPLV